MLILKTLSRDKPMHGFAIAEFILATSSGVLRVEEGSLYPALQRMLLKDWIAGEWGKTDENRRARYYRLTPKGRRQLIEEQSRWKQLVRAVARTMKPVKE